MTECERLKKCPFFTGQMANMPSVAELLKSEYDTRRAREILAGG